MKKITREEFLAIKAEKKLKLTAAQQRVHERVLAKDRIVIRNRHHQSGGEWSWENWGHHEGKLYTSFWNYINAVLGWGYSEHSELKRDDFFAN